MATYKVNLRSEVIWINAYCSSNYKSGTEYKTASDLLVFDHAI